MVSSLSACLEDEPYGGGRTDDVPDGTPVYKLGAQTSYETGLDGLSAICLNEAGNGLLVAQDNGNVLEYDFSGKLLKTNAMPNPDGRSKVDLEGIALSADGGIFLCEERLREVWKLSADHKSMTFLCYGPNETSETGYEENQGYEGIAAGPGVLYVANQSGPKRVYKYTMATGAWTTAFNADWATSLSDIFYDDEDGTLWITDGKTRMLTQVKTDGTRLQEIDISFVNKPEGFCKDKANQVFWFVCDKKKKIHKVSYVRSAGHE